MICTVDSMLIMILPSGPRALVRSRKILHLCNNIKWRMKRWESQLIKRHHWRSEISSVRKRDQVGSLIIRVEMVSRGCLRNQSRIMITNMLALSASNSSLKEITHMPDRQIAGTAPGDSGISRRKPTWKVPAVKAWYSQEKIWVPIVPQSTKKTLITT